MGVRINSNIPASNAQRLLQGTTQSLAKGMERLATGLRINRAADDAAGLAVAERFRARVLQYTQEVNNLQTGVNVVQMAEGGLAAQQEGLTRLRELAVQAATGTLTAEQREALNQEAQQIIEGINATAENTEYNGVRLLNGTAGPIDLGTEGGIQVNIGESTAASLGIAGVSLGSQEGAAAAIETIDTALSRINQNRAGLGAQQNRLERAIETRQTTMLNTQEAESRIRDLNVARQVVEQTRNQALLQGGLAALTQANMQGAVAARLLGG